MGISQGKQQSDLFNSIDRLQLHSDPTNVKYSTVPIDLKRNGKEEIDPNYLITPVYKGWLLKQGFKWRKRWRKRWFILHGEELVCHHEHSLEIHSIPKYKMLITDITQVIDGPETLFTILSRPGDHPWILRAISLIEKKIWITKLMHCIHNHKCQKQYRIHQIIGLGINGLIKELYDKWNNTKYAVKIMNLMNYSNQELVFSELELLKKKTKDISNDHLIQLYNIYEEENKIFLVLQLCTGGELYDRLIERNRFTEEDIAILMRQILSALQALHSHNILHLNIKPENILFETRKDNSKILLTDYGLKEIENNSSIAIKYSKRSSSYGTVNFMAPEVILSKHYSQAADIFSIGALFYSLLFGYPPFFGKTEGETIGKVIRGEYDKKNEEWEVISQDAKDLLERMLTVDSTKRIQLDEILKHPWFTKEVHANLSLVHSLSRMKKYNTIRKSKAISCFLGLTLSTSSYLRRSHIDVQMIELMLFSISTNGLIDFEIANQLLNEMRISPLINRERLVKFFDQDKDGFISAQDFFSSIKSFHLFDDELVSILFDAFLNAPLMIRKQIIGIDPSLGESPTFGFLTGQQETNFSNHLITIGFENFTAALQLVKEEEITSDQYTLDIKEMISSLEVSNRRLNINEFKDYLMKYPSISDILLFNSTRILSSFHSSYLTEEEMNELHLIGY